MVGGSRVTHIAAKLALFFRMTYLVLCLYVCPPIQEEGDGEMVPSESSEMKGARSILQ